MLILDKTSPEPIPAGKRSVRETSWGNTNAHISGRFWKTLGRTYQPETDRAAREFLEGGR